MRLAKYLAHAGVASRRAAGALIADGTGHGRRRGRHGPGARRRRQQRGRRRRHAVAARAAETYALNKPAGVVSTAERHPRPPDRRRAGADADRRLFPVGRLDVDTKGLLLLTNDGELAQRLTHPRYGVEKEYLARVEGGADRRARCARCARASSSTTA